MKSDKASELIGKLLAVLISDVIHFLIFATGWWFLWAQIAKRHDLLQPSWYEFLCGAVILDGVAMMFRRTKP